MTVIKSLVKKTPHGYPHRVHRSMKGRNKKYGKSIKLLRSKGIIKNKE